MKLNKRQLMSGVILTAFGGGYCSYQNEAYAQVNDMDIYILAGQSNMAGRGIVEEQDKKIDPRVFSMNSSKQWVPAVDPLHFDKNIAGVGPGKTFGTTIANNHKGRRIGLIPCAFGGSRISDWAKGSFMGGHYDNAISRAKGATKDGNIKGIIWHQGESDRNPQDAPQYYEKMKILISNFRNDLGNSSLPFVIGQLGYWSWDNFRQEVDAAHKKIIKNIPKTALASSTGLVHKGDNEHFDSASYRILGDRFAKSMLSIGG
jgi:Carbohydrate esterase, sialic acid-specific acetylesterase